MKAEIEKLQQFVAERDSTIKSLNIDLANRDSAIENKDSEIEGLNT